MDIEFKQQTIQKILQSRGLDGLIVTSFDRYLNEYVPLSDCHRHDVTGFTGSVAESLVPAKGATLIFVDGRYHEQADKECPSDLVEVIKCSYGVSNFQALKETIQKNGYQRLAIEGDRMGVVAWRELSEICHVEVLESQDLQAVGFGHAPIQGEVELVGEDLTGESITSKLKRLCSENDAVFVPSLDSSAWLTNTRGYQLPYQSTSRMQAFARADGVTIIPDRECKLAPKVREHFSICDDIKRLNVSNLEKIIVYPEMTTVADYLALQSLGVTLEERKYRELVLMHAQKNVQEIEVMEQSFDKGDTAIYESLCWLKQKVKQEKVTEGQFNQQTAKFYSEQGALSLSFKTISGFGSNSSIIHYSKPSEMKTWEPGELALLDSGAFFSGGLATDTTRTILPMGEATPKQKEVYTLVLKGLLQAQNAVFPAGTKGQAIDALARAPMRRFGYDYAHGTGHGVGINVHEGGYSLTPMSQEPLYAGRVGSIEPGIYLPGFGGVRLENIVVVEQHPQFSHMLRFRPLVWIGFEAPLIDQELLTHEELVWLQEYEAQCAKRGRSFLVD
jgi:Xaa-Pro aminopeptidase